MTGCTLVQSTHLYIFKGIPLQFFRIQLLRDHLFSLLKKVLGEFSYSQMYGELILVCSLRLHPCSDVIQPSFQNSFLRQVENLPACLGPWRDLLSPTPAVVLPMSLTPRDRLVFWWSLSCFTEATMSLSTTLHVRAQCGT